jgi:transposase
MKSERTYCDANFKRLEQGEFRFPRSGEVALEITAEQLLRLLSGLEIAQRRAS